MKKIYQSPDIEVKKFALSSDILVSSDPEGALNDFDGGLGDYVGPGWGWPE